MFSRGNIVALNIEADSIRYLVVKGKAITSWGSVPLAPGLVKDGFIHDQAQVSSAIVSMFRESRIPNGKVIISLTGLRSLPRMFNLPKLKPKLLEDALRSESEREMPVPLNDLYLSWQSLNTTNSQLQFFALGVPRDLLDAEFETLIQANIRPHHMELKPLALVRAVNQDYALILDLEVQSFDLVVVVGGIPIIMRTIPSRGEGPALDHRIGQLASELSRTIDFYNSGHPDNTLDRATPLYLTGRLADDCETDALAKAGLLQDDNSPLELIRSAIDNPIETITPELKYPTDLPTGEYAVNIGLILGEIAPKTKGRTNATAIPITPLDVLPPKYRPLQLSTVRKLYPFIALMLIALLIVTYQASTDSQSETTRTQTQLDSLNQQLEIMIEREELTQLAVEEVTNLKNEREEILGSSNLTDTLGAVLDITPPEITLESISQTEASTRLIGTGTSYTAVSAYIDALNKTEKFSTVYLASLAIDGTSFSIVCLPPEDSTSE